MKRVIQSILSSIQNHKELQENHKNRAKLERIREIVGHLQPVGKFGEIQKILNK
jgi:hypothetical protein